MAFILNCKWNISKFNDNFTILHVLGLLIGIPITMAALYAYRRGCFGIFGYRPSPADYGRAFYKRAEFREDLHM